MRYWDDIEIGETTRSSAMRVDEAAMVEFACKYDPQPFHTDRQAAKESLFDGLIASGIYTAALWRLMDHEVSGDIAFICGVAWDEVKWRRPVRPGRSDLCDLALCHEASFGQAARGRRDHAAPRGPQAE